MESDSSENPILLAMNAEQVLYRMKLSPNPPQEICAYVGYRRHTDWLWGTNYEKYVDTMRFGDEIVQNLAYFDPTPLIKNSILNFDVACHLIQYICFQKLQVDLSEYPIWISLPSDVKVPIPIEHTHDYTFCENIFQNDHAYQQVQDQFQDQLNSLEIRFFDNAKTQWFE